MFQKPQNESGSGRKVPKSKRRVGVTHMGPAFFSEFSFYLSLSLSLDSSRVPHRAPLLTAWYIRHPAVPTSIHLFYYFDLTIGLLGRLHAPHTSHRVLRTRGKA